ncbi:hypothetical protein ACA910_015497 [Epithemia clementina (nom. ined.)]
MIRAACTRSRSHVRASTLFQPLLSPYSDSRENSATSNKDPIGPKFWYAARNAHTFPQQVPISSTFSLAAATIAANNHAQWHSRRNFSSTTSAAAAAANDSPPTSQTTPVPEGGGDTTAANVNVDEALDRLFAEKPEALFDTVVAWEPTWYNVADQAVLSIKFFHDNVGVEYATAIVGVTCLLRLALFPIMIMSQRATSRMAHLNPEMKQLQARFERIQNPSRQDQLQYSNDLKHLFKRYDVNPIRAFIAPIVQLPLFMGMFFGLQKMGKIFPEEFKDGGMFWFPDLTATDPYYILPLLTSVSFFALTELTKHQIASSGDQGQFMVTFMRIMALIMFPIMLNFEASMLCYWTTNNILTLAQTQLLQTASVRKVFGIWDKPKPVPGHEPPSLIQQFQNIAKRMRGEPISDEMRMKEHNRAIDTKNKAYEMMMKAKQRRNNGSSL